MSIIATGLTVITSLFKSGDKGGIIKKIMGIFGKIKCLGGTAYPQSQYESDVAYMETTMGYMANYPDSIPDLQRDFNTIVAFRDTNKQNVGNMSNACTKQRMNDFVGVCESFIAECNQFFEYSGTVAYERWGKIFQVPRIVKLKLVGTAPTAPPTSPTAPPTSNPTTPPVVNPPTLPPVFTTNNGGLSTTYIPNDDGSTTVSTYNPNTGQTSQSTVPTSSLDVNLGGSVGDWQFGASNTSNNTMPYILGGGALLYFLILKNKK